MVQINTLTYILPHTFTSDFYIFLRVKVLIRILPTINLQKMTAKQTITITATAAVTVQPLAAAARAKAQPPATGWPLARRWSPAGLWRTTVIVL